MPQLHGRQIQLVFVDEERKKTHHLGGLGASADQTCGALGKAQTDRPHLARQQLQNLRVLVLQHEAQDDFTAGLTARLRAVRRFRAQHFNVVGAEWRGSGFLQDIVTSGKQRLRSALGFGDRLKAHDGHQCHRPVAVQIGC